jgi:hypothetical protein
VAHIVAHLRCLPTEIAFSAHGRIFLHFPPRGTQGSSQH